MLKSSLTSIYGLLPQDWGLNTITALIDLGIAHLQTGPFGTALLASEYVLVGTPVIAVKDIGHNRIHIDDNTPRVAEDTRQRLNRYSLKEGDIVFGRKGAVDRRAIVTHEQEGWLQGSDCIRLRLLSEQIHPKFVSYVLGTRQCVNWILQNAGGSTMPSLNQNIIGRIQIPLPPLTEQRVIAEILSSIDDKIELNRRMNETLEETARAIFKSWFVDFEPVHAKAHGGMPIGMDEETAALFPDNFEESELGSIPRGWRVEVIGDIANANTRILSKKDNLDFIDYIEISEVMRGEIGNIKTYSRGEEPSRARRRLQHGDVAISTVRPDRGSYFLALNPSHRLIASTGFAVFTPRCDWAFVYCCLIRPVIFERLGALADGAAYPAVSPETIAALPVVIPSETLKQAFQDIVVSRRNIWDKREILLRDAFPQVYPQN